MTRTFEEVSETKKVTLGSCAYNFFVTYSLGYICHGQDDN